MKKYEVLSPFLCFSAKDEKGKVKEFSLKKGDTVDLPEADVSVRALVARKQIKEVEAKPKEVATSTTTK